MPHTQERLRRAYDEALSCWRWKAPALTAEERASSDRVKVLGPRLAANREARGQTLEVMNRLIKVILKRAGPEGFAGLKAHIDKCFDQLGPERFAALKVDFTFIDECGFSQRITAPDSARKRPASPQLSPHSIDVPGEHLLLSYFDVGGAAWLLEPKLLSRKS